MAGTGFSRYGALIFFFHFAMSYFRFFFASQLFRFQAFLRFGDAAFRGPFFSPIYPCFLPPVVRRLSDSCAGFSLSIAEAFEAAEKQFRSSSPATLIRFDFSSDTAAMRFSLLSSSDSSSQQRLLFSLL